MNEQITLFTFPELEPKANYKEDITFFAHILLHTLIFVWRHITIVFMVENVCVGGMKNNTCTCYFNGHIILQEYF